MRILKSHTVIFILVSSIFFAACFPMQNKDREKERIKQKALDQFNYAYNDKFKILAIYDERNPVYPSYDIYACPVAEPDIIFDATYNKKGGYIIDTYPWHRWVYEGSKDLKNYLKPWFPKAAVLVAPRIDYINRINLKKIPSFGEALKKTSGSEDYLQITIYIFKDYTDSSTATIFEGLRQVVAFYDSTNLDYINFDLEFYDEAFFQNMDTDNQQYCFSGGIFYYPNWDWKCFEDRYYVDYVSYGGMFNTKEFVGLPSNEFLEKKIVKYDHSRLKKKNDSLSDSTG